MATSAMRNPNRTKNHKNQSKTSTWFELLGVDQLVDQASVDCLLQHRKIQIESVATDEG